MKTGTNKNGVTYVNDGKKTTCFYNLSSDVELSKTYKNKSQTYIEKIKGIDLLKK